MINAGARASTRYATCSILLIMKNSEMILKRIDGLLLRVDQFNLELKGLKGDVQQSAIEWDREQREQSTTPPPPVTPPVAKPEQQAPPAPTPPTPQQRPPVPPQRRGHSAPVLWRSVQIDAD